MNYFSVIEERTKSLCVQVYDSEVSNFEFAGQLSIKRLYDSLGCDNGMQFYCKYDNYNLEFTTNDLVPSVLHKILSSAKQNERACFRYPLNFQGNDSYVNRNGNNIPMKILLLKSDVENTIDFELQIDATHKVVIELTVETFEELVKQI